MPKASFPIPPAILRGNTKDNQGLREKWRDVRALKSPRNVPYDPIGDAEGPGLLPNSFVLGMYVAVLPPFCSMSAWETGVPADVPMQGWWQFQSHPVGRGQKRVATFLRATTLGFFQTLKLLPSHLPARPKYPGKCAALWQEIDLPQDTSSENRPTTWENVFRQPNPVE